MILSVFMFVENNFQDDKCEYYVELLRKCCSTLSTPSVSCEGFNTPTKSAKS